MNRRYLVIAFIIFILAITSVPVSTQQAVDEYDPWADMNDDGKIDIYDVAYVAIKFGTYGTAINKTELLLDLLERVVVLETKVVELNTTIVYLNETVTILNSTGLGTPDYDSGWQSLSYGSTLYLTHNLNTTDLFVYFIGRYYSGETPVIHQYSFGSQWDPRVGNAQHGAWWAATNTTVILYRGMHDYGSFQPWEYVRVLIWKVPEP